MKRLLPIIFLLAIILAPEWGCRKMDGVTAVTDWTDTTSTEVTTFLDADGEISVVFNGASASVSGAAAIGWPFSIDGAYVVLGDDTTTVKNLTISVSGSTSAGALKIYNANKFTLNLNGVSITSGKNAAINIQCKKRCFVILGGNNSITDAKSSTGAYTLGLVETEDCKGTLFSEGGLVFSGSGSLTVAGRTKHAIASDDFISVEGGTVTVEEAATDGLHANDSLLVSGGIININSTGEGIQVDEGPFMMSSGNVTIKTSGAKGHGIKTDLAGIGDISIDGGTLNISVAGTASKAIKSEHDVIVNGGTLNLSTSGGTVVEDGDLTGCACIKADHDAYLYGGEITCRSTGAGGKGIRASNQIIIGKNAGSEGPVIDVTTTGAKSTSGSYTCSPKGIKGGTKGTAAGGIIINGGKVYVYTTGGNSMTNIIERTAPPGGGGGGPTPGGGGDNKSKAEGIESKYSLAVNGGYVVVEANDDAMNAAGQIVFNGGNVFAYSTGNDAIDSNYGKTGSIIFNSGCTVMAHSTSSPEEGIDADSMSRLTYNGGTVFSSGGLQGGSSSATMGGSGHYAYKTSYSVKAGYFTVVDGSGKVLMSCYVPRDLSQCYSIIASSEFSNGGSYKYANTTSAKPSNPTSNWGKYYYYGGTCSSASTSLTLKR
ncbi:MAG: carbohydrate-binding domain-containing protein [Bacteroidales bacterium]|nr:carbohydrate-binding domain-containing protein [Bacteroidales bacterium]